MKIEPTMFRQIVNCMDQLLEVYEFNINASDCTPFNGSIIRCALSSKIDQLKSLRRLFINMYNSSCLEDGINNEEKDIRQIQLVCDRCGETFKVNVPFDENGVSVSPVIFSRYCSKCINEVGNNEVKK